MYSTPSSDAVGDHVVDAVNVVDPEVEVVYTRHLDHVLATTGEFLGSEHNYDAVTVGTEIDRDGGAQTSVTFRLEGVWHSLEEVRAAGHRAPEEAARLLQEINGPTRLALASRLGEAGMLPNRIRSLVVFRLNYHESQWDYGPLLDPADSEYQRRNWSLEHRRHVAERLWSDYLEAWSEWWQKFLDGTEGCQAITYVHMGRGTHSAVTRFVDDDHWVINHGEAYARRSDADPAEGEESPGFQALMEEVWDVADRHDLGVVRRALENVDRAPCDVVLRYDPGTGRLSEEWLPPKGSAGSARVVGSRFTQWLAEHGYVRYQGAQA